MFSLFICEESFISRSRSLRPLTATVCAKLLTRQSLLDVGGLPKDVGEMTLMPSISIMYLCSRFRSAGIMTLPSSRMRG
jgi:hypothetical protein